VAVYRGDICREEEGRCSFEVYCCSSFLGAVAEACYGGCYASLDGLEGSGGFGLLEGTWEVRCSRVRGLERHVDDILAAFRWDLAFGLPQEGLESLLGLVRHGVGGRLGAIRVVCVSVGSGGAVGGYVYVVKGRHFGRADIQQRACPEVLWYARYSRVGRKSILRSTAVGTIGSRPPRASAVRPGAEEGLIGVGLGHGEILANDCTVGGRWPGRWTDKARPISRGSEAKCSKREMYVRHCDGLR
jgi:hypothetical protein